MSFKEYYDSKQRLILETTRSVVFKTKHDVYKYCKVPFTIDGEKKYISFKPKDMLIVEWERVGNEIKPLKFEMNDIELLLLWNEKKMKSWVETSTTQLFD